MTSRSLRRDLRNRTHERLQQFIEDTFSLYDMGNLSPNEAAQTISDSLMAGLVAMVAHSDCDPDEAGRILAKQIRAKHKEDKA